MAAASVVASLSGVGDNIFKGLSQLPPSRTLHIEAGSLVSIIPSVRTKWFKRMYIQDSRASAITQEAFLPAPDPPPVLQYLSPLACKSLLVYLQA